MNGFAIVICPVFLPLLLGVSANVLRGTVMLGEDDYWSVFTCDKIEVGI